MALSLLDELGESAEIAPAEAQSKTQVGPADDDDEDEDDRNAIGEEELLEFLFARGMCAVSGFI